MNEPVATEPKVHATKPVRVKLFEDRAEVARTAAIELSGERCRVLLGGLTPLVDDRSIRVRSTGRDVRVLAARVIRRMRNPAELGREEFIRVESAMRELTRTLAALHRRRERNQVEMHRLRALEGTWSEGMAQVPLGSCQPWRATWERLSEAGKTNAEAAQSMLDEQQELNERIAELQGRLELSRSASPICEALVEVQLEGGSAVEAELEIVYRTPCAVWRPEHLARLSPHPKEKGASWLELATSGVVWQRTGENWEDVEIGFSTARPADAASPPLLVDDVLTRRKKREEDIKRVQVGAREQGIASVRQTSAAAEMPGVDDGGKPLEFHAKGRYTLPSDGQPLRVALTRTGLKSVQRVVLYPERMSAAHLLAEAVWSGGEPILAGPVMLDRNGGLVGRARLDFLSPGEKLELGFGPDDLVRCRRKVEEERKTTAITGAQVISRRVRLWVSSLADEERRVEVTERIPVSEIEGLEIKPGKLDGWAADGDGFLRRVLELGPRETLEIGFQYEIRAKSNMDLSF